MESLLATPVQPLEVMVGKLAPYVMRRPDPDRAHPDRWRGCCSTCRWRAAGWACRSAVLLFIVGSLALGFLISTLARTQLQAMQMAFFYILPSILLSGFMFPFRGMPGWAQAIGR